MEAIAPEFKQKDSDNLYSYRCKVLRVVDGDTVELEIDLGLDTYRSIRCRLYRINAPEKNTPEGRAAWDWLTDRLSRAQSLVANTIKDRTEKYGRYLVVLTDESSKSINLEMISEGHAVAYNGGPR